MLQANTHILVLLYAFVNAFTDIWVTNIWFQTFASEMPVERLAVTIKIFTLVPSL